MFIQIETTPNPETLQFLPGRPVLESGAATFQSEEQAQGCPLALQLLAITGVSTVFFARDFISVTKTASADWFSLKPLILESLVNYFATHERVLMAPQPSDQVDLPDDEITAQIRELIDTRVRPAVAMDGGDITFESFSNGVVYVRLQGACAGCPSSSATLKSGIENMLRYYVPEVEEVRPLADNLPF